MISHLDWDDENSYKFRRFSTNAKIVLGFLCGLAVAFVATSLTPSSPPSVNVIPTTCEDTR